MKNKIIQISIIIGLLFSIQVSAAPIKSIELLGLDIIPNSTVLNYLPVNIGDEITDKTSDQIIKTLFATGFFSDVVVSIENETVYVALVENAHIKYIDVLNYSDKVLNSGTVSSTLNTYGLGSGEVYNKRSLFEVIAALKAMYIAEGFYNIKIEQSIDLDLQNRIGIELVITEGDRAKIGTMNINGSAAYSEKKLLDLFDIGTADNFIINFFTDKDRYTDKALNRGLEKLRNLYSNNGYLDFSVNSVNTSLSDDKETISIAIEVSEGAQYTLGDLTFSGNLGNQSANDLLALFSLNSGAIFNRQQLVNSIQKINYLYADQGYAHADINPVTEEDAQSNSVHLNVNITLNKKAYINRVNITGNTRTQDEVIRREIGLSEGGLYSASVISESLNRLRRLGFFSNVSLQTSRLEDMPDKIDLNFIVQETKTGALSAGISHSNSFGMSFNAGIREKNFLGSGNTLNAELQYSETFKKLSFYFENPYFNNEKHSINYGVFVSTIDDNEIAQDSYQVNTKGLSFGYGVPLTENTRLNAKLQYSNNNISCGSTFAGVDYEAAQCASANKNEIKLNLNWTENTLNHYMYPTEGTSNALNIDLGLPLGDYQYIKIDANHRSYKSLKNNLTLKLTADLGIATGYGSEGLPFYKRYFGGGSGSVRGFKSKTLGPVYPNGNPKGGEFSILASANIISPITFIDDSENMRMSVFVDMGNVYENISLDLGELRMSTGIAFAYMSPIGAIGVYTALPILKKDGDVTEDFAVSLGTGF
jgi:outer membrane protein insertion porin family